MARPFAQRQMELRELLADPVRHAHHEIRSPAGSRSHPPAAGPDSRDRDRAHIRDRRPAASRGGVLRDPAHKTAARLPVIRRLRPSPG
jgi:hypothetical protein